MRTGVRRPISLERQRRHRGRLPRARRRREPADGRRLRASQLARKSPVEAASHGSRLGDSAAVITTCRSFDDVCREVVTGLAISRQAGSRSRSLMVALPYTVPISATVGALLLMLHRPQLRATLVRRADETKRFRDPDGPVNPSAEPGAANDRRCDCLSESGRARGSVDGRVGFIDLRRDGREVDRDRVLLEGRRPELLATAADGRRA